MTCGSPNCVAAAPAADHVEAPEQAWGHSCQPEGFLFLQQGYAGAAPVSSTLHRHCFRLL